MNRRRFLATTGSSFSLLVSGCTSVDVNSTSGSSSPPERSTPESTPTTSPTATQTPIPTLDNVDWTHSEFDASGTRYVSGTVGPTTKPRTAWRVESSGILGFAFAERRLFALRETACVALDATSGETVWEVSLPSPNMPATANVTAMPGPVYADNTVFLAAGNNLRALSSGDGSEQWTISPPGGPITDLAVTGGRVYVTTAETDSGDSGYLTAVETGDGSERWRMAADQIRQPAGTIASEVAVDGDTVAAISAMSDGSYTVNFTVEKTDGAKRWTSTGRNHGRALTVADDRVYTGGFQGYVGSENATTGERLWEANVGPPVKTIAVGDERVYVSTEHVSGAQIATFSKSGDQRWMVEGSGVLAVADGVYIAQPSMTRALDRRNGNERWSLPRSSESNPVGLAVLDSILFEATENTVRALVET